VARWLADFHVAGVALAVIKDGQIAKMQGYGRANREDRGVSFDGTSAPA